MLGAHFQVAPAERVAWKERGWGFSRKMQQSKGRDPRVEEVRPTMAEH